MTRKISKKIRLACQIVERLGTAQCSDLNTSFSRCDGLSQLLNTGVARGLLTTSRDVWPAQYKVVNDWREIVDALDLPPEVKRRTVETKYAGKYDARALVRVWK